MGEDEMKKEEAVEPSFDIVMENTMKYIVDFMRVNMVNNISLETEVKGKVICVSITTPMSPFRAWRSGPYNAESEV